MKAFCRKIWSFLIALILCNFVLLTVYSNAKGTIPEMDLVEFLQSRGYKTDTPEQIIEATKSQSYPIRYMALVLLTQRIEKKAIPTLKEALDDSKMEVRWRAAHLLGTLGNKSGLERMRRDLKEYAPNNGVKIPLDPNITNVHEIKMHERKTNLNHGYALYAAKVLAELGDRSGYELAARMAIHGPEIYLRTRAIDVLVKISKTNKEILSKESKYPEKILLEVAESEENLLVIKSLMTSTWSLDVETQARVLEKIANSPYISDDIREEIESRLERIHAKTKKIEP